MFQFQHPGLIVLFGAIGVLGLLFILLLRWKQLIRKKAGDPHLVNLLVPDYSKGLFNIRFLVVCIALALGIVAAINPRIPGSSESNTRSGIDVVIALDVSKSMLATDLQPTRLDRAKQFISKMMNAMPDDRIALVLFAGKAYLQMPLTIDHGAAKMFVSSAAPDAVPQQGTVISEALNMSANVFDNEDQRYKAVLLISDGEDHDEQAIETAKLLSERGVMINTVGVGSVNGTTLTDPLTGDTKKDETGAVVVTRLNETTLQAIAKETNGVYIGLNSSDEAVTVLKAQLSQIETKSYTDLSQVAYASFYSWFIGAMLVLLVLEVFIPERKKMKQ